MYHIWTHHSHGSIPLRKALSRETNLCFGAFQKERPIIFVGHSLGGLVIKDALCKANEYRATNRNARVAAIIASTYGIAFLGTPHRGGNHVAWAKIATNFASIVLKDHNARVIDALTRGTLLQYLLSIRAKRSCPPRLRNHFSQE